MNDYVLQHRLQVVWEDDNGLQHRLVDWGDDDNVLHHILQVMWRRW